jgi:hypothetical protein
MKRTTLTTLLISFLLILNSASAQESITMDPGYANDVYFSIEDGVVGIAERANWDIGFYTSPWSAGIITNGGNGVQLYIYPHGDTTSWMSTDTSGMSGWPILYNGEDSWENGAFNRNSGNHPDYGWGVYNAITHNVVGDSIYVIKLADGTYKKIWIVEKISVENKYIIRYANLDNSSEEEKTLDINNYAEMNFSYFDFASGSLFEREPNTEDWDILFTKYQAMQPEGVPYPVIGVLNNVTAKANRSYPVGMNFDEWYTQPMDSSKAVIGFDWKSFDMQAFQWALEDSLIFFVGPSNGNIYKLYFTLFAGSSSGDIEFELETVSLLGTEEINLTDAEIHLMPNPASDMLTVSWNGKLNQHAALKIFDLTGKEVMTDELNGNASGGELTIDVSRLQHGMYILSIISGENVITEKLIVN